MLKCPAPTVQPLTTLGIHCDMRWGGLSGGVAFVEGLTDVSYGCEAELFGLDGCGAGAAFRLEFTQLGDASGEGSFGA